jgi:hypothetical protein
MDQYGAIGQISATTRSTTMTTRTRAAAIAATLAFTAALVVMTAGPAAAYDFPSTNDANRVAGLPHVNLVSTGPGSVTLEFMNPRNAVAFFEYRIDGQTVGSAAHPVVIGDVIHPGVCVDGRSAPPPTGCFTDSTVETFEGSSMVEVRLALGGERDWDFDWTPFAVGPNNECGTPGTNRLSVGDASVVEGDSGVPRKLRIPVTISNPSATEITVDFVIDEGSATAPDDFDANVGVVRTLKFKPNMATTKTISVSVLPDAAIEGDEAFNVTLSNPSGGYSIGRAIGTGTIIDDDDSAEEQAVAISGVSTCEGDSSTKGNKVSYQVSLRAPAAADTEATVMVVDGSATGDADYRAFPKAKTVKFKAGQVQKPITVTVLPDLSGETAENVNAFIDTSPLPVLSIAASAEVVILNDDGAVGV